LAAFFEPRSDEVFRLSPRGDQVVFLRAGSQGSALHVAGVDQPRDSARRISAGEDWQITAFFWAGEHFLAFSAQTVSGGTRIACADLSGANGAEEIVVRTLAEPGLGAELVGSITAPDSSAPRLVLGLPSPDRAGFVDLHTADAATGERKILHKNVEGISFWNVSRSGRQLLGIRPEPDGAKTLISVRGGKAAPLLRCAPGESLNLAGIHGDDSRAYLMTNSGPDTGLGRLESVDLVTGTRAVVAQDPLGEVDFQEALFSRDGMRLLGARYLRGRAGYDWSCPETEALFQRVSALLPPGEVRLTEGSLDGKRWLLTLTRDTAPEAEYHYDAETNRMVRLDRRDQTIDPDRLGRMEPVAYPARDGCRIPGYLTLPPGTGPAAPPLVVFPHGGPNKRNTWGYDPRVQFLVSRGYAVFQPNFRGSSGFGRDFETAGYRGWGRGVMQDDLTDGVEWLIRRKVVDPGRIAILGGSYGGFAALAGLAFTPGLYAAGVCLFGASDLPAFVREIPPRWKPFQGDLNLKIGNPGDPEDVRRLVWQSPLHATDAIKAPVLVYHGARDNVVKISQAQNFVAACRARNLSVEYLVAPDEGHGFADPANEQAVYRAIEVFLARHLGGSSPDSTPPEIEDRLTELRTNGRQ
jgi:dienelactone hydrolase